MKKIFRKKMWMFPFFMIGMGALVGLVIMSLWNWMMPAIFGLGVITFWQAIGMFILGRLLFGGFKKHRHWGMMKHRYAYAYSNGGQKCCHPREQEAFKNTQEDHSVTESR